jgi:hypothetical protein
MNQMTMNEWRKLYPIGTRFVDRFGQQCVIRGYRNNRRLGVQVIVNATHVWEDGYQEMHKQALFPESLEQMVGKK